MQAAPLCLKAVSLDSGQSLRLHVFSRFVLLALDLTLTTVIFISTLLILATSTLRFISTQFIVLLFLSTAACVFLVLAVLLSASLSSIFSSLLLGQIEAHITLRTRWSITVTALGSNNSSGSSSCCKSCNGDFLLPR